MYQEIRTCTKYIAMATGLLVLWMFSGGPFSTYYLIWNLLLAWIPMICALFFLRHTHLQATGRPKLWGYGFGVLWLFFSPNALYLITDFIHLSQEVFYGPNPSFQPYGYEPRTLYYMDLLPWHNFFSITFAVILGLGLFVLSLYIVHDHVEKTLGKKWGWVFVWVLQLLSGYALYMGRFLRVNSWDVFLRPWTLLQSLFQEFGPKTLYFTGLFALIGFLVYGLFYGALYLGEGRRKP